MLEQISTSRDRYILTEQSYTPTKQSNETCNMLSLYKSQMVHFIHQMYQDSLVVSHKAKKKQHAHAQQT